MQDVWEDTESTLLYDRCSIYCLTDTESIRKLIASHRTITICDCLSHPILDIFLLQISVTPKCFQDCPICPKFHKYTPSEDAVFCHVSITVLHRWTIFVLPTSKNNSFSYQDISKSSSAAPVGFQLV